MLKKSLVLLLLFSAFFYLSPSPSYAWVTCNSQTWNYCLDYEDYSCHWTAFGSGNNRAYVSYKQTKTATGCVRQEWRSDQPIKCSRGCGGGSPYRDIWGRVRSPNNSGGWRYWAGGDVSHYESPDGTRGRDPSVSVNFINTGDSADTTKPPDPTENRSASFDDWAVNPLASDWNDNIANWYFKAGIYIHKKFYAVVAPVSGYQCDTWEYWVGSVTKLDAQLHDSGSGCQTSVFDMSYNGGRIYFNLKPKHSLPSATPSLTPSPCPPVLEPSRCNCQTACGIAMKQRGDFNCSATIDIDDFSIWVVDRIYLSPGTNIDCNDSTQSIQEFDLWLTGYLANE